MNLKEILREIIKQQLMEMSSTGGTASFSPGTGEQYTTPKAFGKKKKKPTSGYKPYKQKIKNTGASSFPLDAGV